MTTAHVYVKVVDLWAALTCSETKLPDTFSYPLISDRPVAHLHSANE